MQKQSLKNTARKCFTAVMAILTAMTPVASVIPAYAEDDLSDGITSSIVVDPEGSVVSSDDGIEVATVQDTHKICIDLDSFYGEATVQTDAEGTQTVRVSENADGEQVASVVDDEGTLVSQTVLTEEAPYALVLTEPVGTIVHVTAKADAGYDVATYAVTIDSGAIIGEESTEFDKDEHYASFVYDVVADEDKTVKVDFAEGITIGTDDSIVVTDPVAETESVDSSIVIGTESSTEAIDVSVIETEPVVDAETESVTEAETEGTIVEEETEAPIEDASIVETEAETEDVFVIETEAETEDTVIETEASNTEEHFLEYSDDIDELDDADFASMRLVVMAEDGTAIIDPEHVIANYGDIYLLQYSSVEQAQTAFLYYVYESWANAVEPDMVMEAADEAASDENLAFDVVEGENPVQSLADESDAPTPRRTSQGVIALIDTGAMSGPNVIDQISLIDDVMSGNGHGDAMVIDIVSQNPNVSILSIRAMDNNGYGTVSSIVSAMEYAINADVAIINLSLYAKTTMLNSVLREEIQKAVNAGIIVVGAAGNDGADVAAYMPGSVEDAYIIGAANEDGSRLNTSNFGETVDFNVVADSTSSAAAKFTGYISQNGTDSILCDNPGGLIFSTDYAPSDDDDIVINPDDYDMPGIYLQYDFLPYYDLDPEGMTVGVAKQYSIAFEEKDGYYSFCANPYPDILNVDEIVPHNVVVSPGEPSNVFITDDTLYDAETGVVRIPVKYFESGVDVLFGMTLSNASVLYRDLVPDDMKVDDTPDEFKIASGMNHNTPQVTNPKYSGYVKTCAFVAHTRTTKDSSIENIKKGDIIKLEKMGKTTWLRTGHEPQWRTDILTAYNPDGSEAKWIEGTWTFACISQNTPTAHSAYFVPYSKSKGAWYTRSHAEVVSVVKSTKGDTTKIRVKCWIGLEAYNNQNQGCYLTVDYTKVDKKKGSIQLEKLIQTNSNLCWLDENCTTLNPLYGDAADLSDAKFVVYDYATKKKVGTLSTDKQGKTDVLEVPAGKYYIVETQAPNGCDRYGNGKTSKLPVYVNGAMESVKIFEVDPDDNMKGKVNLKAYNDPKGDPMELFYKATKDGKPSTTMEGAEFTLEYWAEIGTSTPARTADRSWVFKTINATDAYGNTYGTLSFDDAHLVSGTRFEASKVDGSYLWPLGIYRLTETKAPEGLTLIPGTISLFGCLLDSDVGFSWNLDGSIFVAEREDVIMLREPDEPPTFVDISIQKLDADSGTTTPTGNCDLAGITFGVYNAAGGYIASMVTDANGYATTQGLGQNGLGLLPVGATYVVQEVSTNGKYQITTGAAITVAIPADAVPNSVIPVGSISNPPNKGGILEQKLDIDLGNANGHGDAILNGATYYIVNNSAHQVKNNAGNMIASAHLDVNTLKTLGKGEAYNQVLAAAQNGCLVETMATNAQGVAVTGQYDLTYGDYLVIEAAPPGTYHLDMNWVGYASISANGQYVEPIALVQTEYAVGNSNQDEVFKGGLMVQKSDLMLNRVADHADGTLEGAAFSIVNASAAAVKNKDGNVIPTSGLTGDAVTYNQVMNAINSGCVVQTIVTDRNGKAMTGNRDLPYGRYYVIETSPEPGYHCNTSWVGYVDIDEDGTIYPVTVIHNEYNSDEVREPIYRGGVKVQKYDLMLDRNSDHGDTNLEGTEFVIVNASKAVAMNKDGKEIPSANLTDNSTYDEIMAAAEAGSLMQTLVTDRKGFATTGAYDLPYGTYYIVESKPPVAYDVNKTWIAKVVVREDGRIYSLDEAPNGQVLHNAYADSPIRNQIWRGGVEVQKFDYMRDTDKGHGDADLSGAEFAIVNASLTVAVNKDGDEIPTSGISGDVLYQRVLAAVKDYKMQTIVTDADGHAATGNQDLPYGTYYIIEVKPPKGYFVNTEWVGKVVVRENGKMYTPDVVNKGMHDETNHSENEDHDISGDALTSLPGHDYATNDQIYRGGIGVDKIDKEMKKNTRQGEAVLSGAEFTIINASLASVRNKDGVDVATAIGSISATPTYAELRKIADAGENTVQVITTDKNGRATTGHKDLPYGTYYVIETKSSYGYFIDEKFVGKVVIRDDNVLLNINETKDNSSFVDINDTSTDGYGPTVDQTPRRKDLRFMKVNIDGEYKAYIPFLISAIRVNADGSETVLESHVVVSDEYGQVSTAASDRPHDNHTNGFDKYIVNGTVTPEGEALLKEASTWGVWFQGNAMDYPKDAINNDYGALYTCHYRITELHCEDNKGLEENLLNSDLLYIYNDTNDLTELLHDNAPMYVYHPLVDTEIVMTSQAIDVESGSKTVPARELVEVKDTVTYTHVSSDHKYRLETQFRDMTDGGRVIKIQGTNDPDAVVSDDSTWITKEFQPEKKSGTNNTYGEQTVSAMLNTKALNGHTIMAVDYLYQYIDISEEDMVPGDWILVCVHPHEGDVDENQYLYVPDLHTTAVDTITGDREGAKNVDDAILDTVEYMNLSTNETYTILMTLVDGKTGEYLQTDADGNPVTVGIDTKTGLIYKSSTKEKTPYSGTVTMKEFGLDSSDFKDNQSVVVVESLYRADGETGELIGEPILVHDSLLDEDQTIRWADVHTTASDRNTIDDVGTDEEDAVVYDKVRLDNIIFDDNDHADGSRYSYTVKGHLVYQKDFMDANGVEHKAGDTVETLDGTQDVVTITSDAAGNITYTYADGTKAEGKILSKRYGMNVGKKVHPENIADNSYVEDNTAVIADIEVEMIYHVNSNVLEGGTVVAYEYLYHDVTSGSDIEIAKHEDITDEGQTVHYPKVRTSACDDATKDDVGALRKDAQIIDTVKLTNLVPGRDYTVNGKLVEQESGKDFLVNGETVTQSASIHVTEDGKIVAENGEKVTVTDYNAEKHEVSGTIDIVFTFDASSLEDRTCVVFEDLIHNGVRVATHSDLSDEGQTVHFPKIRTTAQDGYTKDHVGTVTDKAIVVDTVKYWNLVPGKEYTLSGVLMNKDTNEALLDADGNTITAERTFVAGDEGDGITITDRDEKLNRVSGTIDLTFTFDGSLLEDTTAVVFEDLIHNKIKVTTHTDIHDDDQTIHYPKIRTSAMDSIVGDEVGKVGMTTIVDTVKFWNLIPGMTYEVSGTLMDKDTGEALLVNGETVTQKAVITVNEDGTVTSGNGERVEVTNYDADGKRVDGSVDLTYELDASTLEGKTLVVFEDLIHNDVVVTTHSDLSDLGQTVHFPKIRTTAQDIDTSDHAGTVTETAVVVDTVKYWNLVVGKTYTLKGVLMNQATGAPIVNSDGTFVTAEATFEATTESNDVNTVLSYDEDNHSVDGAYVLKFFVDSRQLAGKTVVVFEDLYHNDVKVTTHSDLTDEEQSVHYPAIRTTAMDMDTGDHVGSIWGSLMNGVRHLFGDTDVDGNGIPDDKQANIVDTVELDNLVPGYTYVVSGKLYNVDASHASGKPEALVIDGEEIVQAVTIMVSEDGKTITSSNGEKTTVTAYDAEKHFVNGTVDLTYTLDSSKIQGVEVVVFENLYHDSSYTVDTDATTVDEEDIIHKHAEIDDKGQSVSEVEIHTTAVDTQTQGHVGTEPVDGNASVIRDEVNLAKLVPGMSYTIEGALVDLDASDFEHDKVLYLKADGTLTENRKDAYLETYTFYAEEETEVHYLYFGLTSDKVQGRTLTVFEDLYHNDVKISSHPSGDGDGWDEESFAAQTVYYPTGKTNATDNDTDLHASLAEDGRVITDRVYFENLLVGETYEIEGYLVYQSDFTDAAGVTHKAGEAVSDEVRAVRFEAAEDLTKADYADGIGSAVIDSVVVTTYPNGQKAISGYVSLEFTVNAKDLAGATVVAFETFKNNGVTVFVHKNLEDLPQTVRIPKIRTTAKVKELDEAAVYNEDGSFKDIEIVDTVTYENLWTQEQLDLMTEQGKKIIHADGTIREQDGNIYDIAEKAEYILKGVLMDTATGEPLVNKAGEQYVVYSEPFSPEASNGSYDVKFVVNAGDFISDDGETELEGKTLVVFEDLYMTDDKTEAESGEHHVGTHHDIDDVEQDIRLPKGRTHATDGVTDEIPEGSLDEVHAGETVTTDHEVYATEDVTITDMVSYENLHGATKYTVTGVLQVVTEFDENGNAVAWEPAKDDDGNVITVTTELDTTSISDDYNDHVSGVIPLTFTFSGVNLTGKRTVVFETFEREGEKVIVHVDINDEAQNIFLPKIHTNATDSLTGLHETIAGADTVILDKVKYENLEYGKTYRLAGVLHNQENGEEIPDAVMEGTFVAGVDNQFITKDGTKVMSMEEFRVYVTGGSAEGSDVPELEDAGDMMHRVDGYVYLAIPVDTSKIAGQTLVAFETLYAPTDEDDNWKPVASHEDLDDLPQTIKIPNISTTAKVVELDETAVYDENGNYRDIEITDTVTYQNLWTQAELDKMAEQAGDNYDITEKATYILKGVLMDKETGELLMNANGDVYVTYSDMFVPETNDGSVDMKFVVNAGDFVKDGETTLEGKSVVVFEDLYRVETQEEAEDGENHVGTHHDINDDEQDIRFPKGRTHVSDGAADDVMTKLDSQEAASLADIHGGEIVTTGHEVNATENIVLTDIVSYENLHGATKYTVTGKLQVVTEFDENGVPKAYEPAKDDKGNEIVVTQELDTSILSTDYNDSVSGYLPLTFTFSGVNLAGKTTVVFETFERDGVSVIVHADITDDAQTVFLPSIHTNASDALTGLDEALAGSDTVILDKVSYENLEIGKTYTLKGVLHDKADGSEIAGATVEGTFVAGTENQFITKDGTKVMTLDELRKSLGGVKTQTSWESAITQPDTTDTTNEADLDIKNKVEYVVGKDIPAGYYKITPGKTDTRPFGYWCIYYSKDGSVPSTRTVDTTLANGIVYEGEAHYILVEDNMVLQLATWCNTGYASVSEGVGAANLDSTLKSFYEHRNDQQQAEQNVVKPPVEETPVGSVENSSTSVTGSMTNRVSGEVYVVIPVDASKLGGHTVVAFETLSAPNRDNSLKVVATHEDIEDEDQTITIPRIQTKAAIDGKKSVVAGGKSTVVDTVTYENLVPGREYIMRGVLMDKSTGKSTEVAAETKFTPKEANGTVEVKFTFETKDLGGRQLVVFEELVRQDDEGNAYVVAEHRDINDEAQTVTIQKPTSDTPVEHIDTGDVTRTGFLLAGGLMAMLLAVLFVIRRRKTQI